MSGGIRVTDNFRAEGIAGSICKDTFQLGLSTVIRSKGQVKNKLGVLSSSLETMQTIRHF